MQAQDSLYGWLPTEIWAKIIDEYAPRVKGLMDDVPNDVDHSFDPYIFSSISCADYEGTFFLRPALAGVNKQLRTLLHDTYAPPRGCLLVTNHNVERVLRRMNDITASGGRNFYYHVILVLHMMPDWSVTLESMTSIIRLTQDVEILSLGAVPYPNMQTDGVEDSRCMRQFTKCLRDSLASGLVRLSLLDGARLLCGEEGYRMTYILNACTRLKSLSCHREFLPQELRIPPAKPRNAFAFRREKIEHNLIHVSIDSPHVKCWDRTKICNTKRLHYIRDGDPHYSYGLDHILNTHDPIASPITHLSLVMSTRPPGIIVDFTTFTRHAPLLHHLRLSAPLSQLTSSIPFIPPTVRTLVLVVDNSVSWNPHLPPAETLPWDRLHNLLLSMRRALHPESRTALKHVQFMQPALIRRLEDEIAQRENVKLEVADMQLEFLNEKGSPMRI